METSFSSVLLNIFFVAVLVWVAVLVIALVSLARRNDIFMPVKIFWSAVIVFAPLAGLLAYLVYGPKRRV
ncbi:phospholipase D-like protein [Mucilaginibacter gracilis]|uniref:Phospholipase D-like protein n=1 Tax=Mucilaginibacter gracilis TaxID=423350 RepID=A0A495J0V7_9SPHI|nr:PLDc N-terminal domain-containing protein [Mucilaginibacter gracilis]RKR81739.1 phospholipase D-like protein [Mucilaginibacter gracilis]